MCSSFLFFYIYIMKKTYRSLFIVFLLSAGLIAQSYSMGHWQWNWQGQQKWKQTNQVEKQVQSDEQKFDFKADTTLTQKEIDRLVLQFEDEYAAIGIYNYFYELYNLQVFKNIAESEQKHLNAIIALMNAYNLEVPNGLSKEFQAEADHLKSMWEWSLREALEAWVLFEIRDIEDIAYTISITENEDIRKVMLNIWWGSFNHLRWFLSNLEKQGFSTDIDYSEFLTEDDLQEKGLKDRFIPYLKNMGVEIDASLLNTKDNTGGNKWNQKWNSNEVRWNQKGEEMKSVQQQRKEFFKNRIYNEMGASLRSMDSDRLHTALNRLELIIENTKKDNNITQEQKQRVMPIYNALKEVLEEIVR